MQLALHRPRTPVIIGAVFVALLIGGFGLLADEVIEGDTMTFDNAILGMLRTPGNPANPLGPVWLEEAARDITALGSYSVLTLLTAAVVIYLFMLGRNRSAWFISFAVVGGSILSTALKAIFDRPRPDLTATVRVFTASFPSGHATTSAVAFLTLGVLLAETAPKRSIGAFFIGLAIFLTILVGLSRIYLGVHFPTDVLAGWALGTAWAVLCWAGAKVMLSPSPTA